MVSEFRAIFFKDVWPRPWPGLASWRSMNCVEGEVSIVKGEGGFVIFDPNGMSLDVGIPFPTFEAAARRLESIFTWTIKIV